MAARWASTVDLATEADWTFVQIPGVHEAIREIAKRTARQAEINADDLEQDLLLYIAVRPTFTDRDWSDEYEPNRFLSAVATEAPRMVSRGERSSWRIDYLEDLNYYEES